MRSTFKISFYFRQLLFVKDSATQQVVKGLYDGATTEEVNTLMAETAATMTTDHSDYALLAGRICVFSLHKETRNLFSGIEFGLFCLVFVIVADSKRFFNLFL